ncbi:hypothetical protein ILYODFUR_032281, partial [Ilyodon furcidens]
QLDADIKEDFLGRIVDVFGVEGTEAAHLYTLLQQCMDHRHSITIFDSESDEQMATDGAILSSVLKGTKASPSEQLSMALAWDRADVAQKDILVYGQHWQVGSLEQAMLDSLVMDRVSFVKSLIDNGMTMSRFLTVDRLEELYNSPQEYLIGGAYRSTYTRKNFRVAYSRMQGKDQTVSTTTSHQVGLSPGLGGALQPCPFNFSDLFVWAVLQQRQQMALFLWQHGEEALARAIVGCKLYRSMAFEVRQSNMDDIIAERFKAYSM